MTTWSNSSNMPILWQNCLGMFRTPVAQKAWVWFAETRPSQHQYSADDYALEVEKLVINLRSLLEIAGQVHDLDDETVSSLEAFILTRHANWRLGGNVRPSYIV